jgi:leucyl aminopeptidase
MSATSRPAPDIRLTGDPAGAVAVDTSTCATPHELRRLAGRLARAFEGDDERLAVGPLRGESLAAFVEGLVLGSYRFGAQRSLRIALSGPTDPSALQAGLTAAAATCWARDLANTPAAVKAPAWLAAQAERELAPLGVDVLVRDVDWLRREGFGGVLAVGGGSAAPPRFVEARWRPRGARPGVHPVLVGKGITFDTGGINLKPADGMRLMHTDMSGSAAVLAALRAAAAKRLPVRVTALVPLAENSLSGSAYRPGDVIRHYGGRTSEVGNTDAEGRLVLADAMAYAVARMKPTALVDVATLTGAAKVALGLGTAALFATSDDLAAGLEGAGRAAGEALWRMPMPADYEPMLRSDVADATNAPGNPGAITAALFLRPFAGDVSWAHLDIAGPARATAEDGMISRGGTGFGARLLLRWLESLA